jgi:hypothetical protein
MYGIWNGTEVIARFVAPLTVKSNHPIFMADTLSLHRKVSRRSAQRWEIETNLEPLTGTANDLMVNFVTSGYSEAMEIVMPQNMGVIKRRTSTSTCTASGAEGASSVSVSGHNGLIPKGTFIRFNNHLKVYMTTTDVDVGDGTMGIYPPLLQSVSNSFYYRDSVIMTGYYDIDTVIGMVFTDGILMDNGTIKIIEKLS